ncbi:MAG: DUF4118 domain-containing protein [Chloroflexota bacterium]
MQFIRSNILPPLLNHLAALFTVFILTVILRELQIVLSIQIIVLLYLLPVIISTTLWGLTPGALAGFTAFLAFNYFFIPPYFKLAVHKTEDLITLVIFFIVAIVLSQMIGQARDGLKLAKSREWEATRMYEFISALSGLQENNSIARTIAEHVSEVLQIDQVEIYIDKQNSDSASILRIPEKKVYINGSHYIRFPMMTVRALEGEIRLWHGHEVLTPIEQRLFETFSSQGALAIERTRLAKAENRAKLLEESDQMKTTLLSSVSHELRSPLATIKASISSLHSGAVNWDSNARNELLAVIEEETDHLNYLVGNLLDMSRIEAGALKPKREWNILAEILDGVLKKMSKTIEKHHITMDIPNNLPLVPTDYVQMEQVFTNLISNSVKYAPENTLISIVAHVPDHTTLIVKVINQGPKVPEESLSRIFEKFFRITAAERITGTGLGLSICKGIIEAHRGKIWAENLANGFSFNFSLPLTLDGVLPHMPKENNDE